MVAQRPNLGSKLCVFDVNESLGSSRTQSEYLDILELIVRWRWQLKGRCEKSWSRLSRKEPNRLNLDSLTLAGVAFVRRSQRKEHKHRFHFDSPAGLMCMMSSLRHHLQTLGCRSFHSFMVLLREYFAIRHFP